MGGWVDLRLSYVIVRNHCIHLDEHCSNTPTQQYFFEYICISTETCSAIWDKNLIFSQLDERFRELRRSYECFFFLSIRRKKLFCASDQNLGVKKLPGTDVQLYYIYIYKNIHSPVVPLRVQLLNEIRSRPDRFSASLFRYCRHRSRLPWKKKITGEVLTLDIE